MDHEDEWHTREQRMMELDPPAGPNPSVERGPAIRRGIPRGQVEVLNDFPKPKINWAITRDASLFIGGVAGMVNELFVNGGQRPVAIAFLAAMLGFPLAFQADKQLGRRKESKAKYGRNMDFRYPFGMAPRATTQPKTAGVSPKTVEAVKAKADDQVSVYLAELKERAAISRDTLMKQVAPSEPISNGRVEAMNGYPMEKAKAAPVIRITEHTPDSEMQARWEQARRLRELRER